VATVVVVAAVLNIPPLLRPDADAVERAGRLRTAASSAPLAHTSRPGATPLRATGFVVPRHSAVVSSEVTGRIVQVAVEEGDKVAAGSIVARLDDTATRADLALARARAAAIASRDGELRVEQALAEEERDSGLRLAASGFISETARSRLHGKVRSIIERRKTLSAELEAARAEMARVHAHLSKHTIVAPIAGVVVSRSRQVGEVVWAEAGSSSGGILTIVDLDDLHIEVDVPESLVSGLRAGEPVRIALDAKPGISLRGSLAFISPTMERNRATARVRVRFSPPVPDTRPGMVAHVQFGGGLHAE
jgi:RND family efflux transporter MFP subunit